MLLRGIDERSVLLGAQAIELNRFSFSTQRNTDGSIIIHAAEEESRALLFHGLIVGARTIGMLADVRIDGRGIDLIFSSAGT